MRARKRRGESAVICSGKKCAGVLFNILRTTNILDGKPVLLVRCADCGKIPLWEPRDGDGAR